MPNDFDSYFIDYMRERAVRYQESKKYTGVTPEEFVKLMAEFDKLEQALIQARADGLRRRV